MKKNNEEINLNLELQRLTEIYVSEYKSDCLHDLNIMKTCKEYGDEFYIYLRDCGTELMVKKHIYFRQSAAFLIANYYKEAAIKLYSVNISRRGSKYIYGTITELPINNFIEDIKNNTLDARYEELLIEKKDGTSIIEKVPTSENTLYMAMNKLKLEVSQIKGAHIINYY